MNIIFARSRWLYHSYADFWRLVELSEFPTCYVDEIDFQSDNLYITSPMNGDYRAHLDNHLERNCKIAHWLLERPGDNHGNFIRSNNELVARGYVDFNIVSDPDLVRHSRTFKYVPMGSHKELGQPGHEKVYDFIGLLAPVNRRMWLFNGAQPRSHIEGLTLAPNIDPVEHLDRRHEALQASRFGLNVHQDEYNYCEPLRFVLFAAYGLPIVTETISKETIYSEAVCMARYDELPHMMQIAVRQYSQWKAWGAYLRDKLTGEYSFRACLERSL